MTRTIGNSPCPCGEWIMGTLTGNVKKCDEHPGELCWLWEWEAGTVCPKCGFTQTFLHQPEGKKKPSDDNEVDNSGVIERLFGIRVLRK